MLTVAPVVTIVRAVLALTGVTEPSWYWVGFAVGGTLSGLGMVLMGIALWRGQKFWWLLGGAAVAVIGHYVLPATTIAIHGPALVQAGTGIVLAPWRRWALIAGGVAAIGAVLRHDAGIGQLLLAAGAAGLLAAIVLAARRAHHKHTS